MYDPKIGRWISEDPIGFQAADANLYRYVGNNPTNDTDHSGKEGDQYRGVTIEKLVPAEADPEGFGSAGSKVKIRGPKGKKGIIVQHVYFEFHVTGADADPKAPTYKTKDGTVVPDHFDYYEALEWGWQEKDAFFPAEPAHPDYKVDPFHVPDFGPKTAGRSEEEGFAVFIENESLYKRDKDGKVEEDDGQLILNKGWTRGKVKFAGGFPTWAARKPPFWPADVVEPNHVLKVKWDDLNCPKIKTTIVKELPK
jgi:hypothetical protein